ncbi:MAG: hypothetical protein SGARI_007374 [Bacillariaceae sp.]
MSSKANAEAHADLVQKMEAYRERRGRPRIQPVDQSAARETSAKIFQNMDPTMRMNELVRMSRADDEAHARLVQRMEAYRERRDAARAKNVSMSHQSKDQTVRMDEMDEGVCLTFANEEALERFVKTIANDKALERVVKEIEADRELRAAERNMDQTPASMSFLAEEEWC